MELTPKIDKHLQEAGYANHCFISWPHTLNQDLTDCAKKLKESIVQGLALSIENPYVFLDESDVIGGDKWERIISDSLCRSIVLIALCAPIYYHSKWCGLEWTTMQKLNEKRIPKKKFGAIIPIIIRYSPGDLPDPVKEIQYYDMSPILTSGRSYYESEEYRQNIRKIIIRIQEVAWTLFENNIKANCEDFQISQESVFSYYHEKKQPMPFRKDTK